jgi:hypothetical protein
VSKEILNKQLQVQIELQLPKQSCNTVQSSKFTQSVIAGQVTLARLKFEAAAGKAN